MKIHEWTDQTAPPLTINNGEMVFFDYPHAYNLAVGDQIQYKTGVGTRTFEVTDVSPANLPDYPPDLAKVVAQRRGE